MAPVPKPKEKRQRWAKRPEVGLVPAADSKAIVPRCPPGLLESSRKRWKAYWLSPVAAAADINSDLHRVERWIQAVDEYERVGKVFRDARLVKGSTGQPVLNPLATYLTQIEAVISRAEQEMGMTPMARLKLGLAIGQAKLTVDALNKSLSESGDEAQPAEAEAWEAEWREA